MVPSRFSLLASRFSLLASRFSLHSSYATLAGCTSKTPSNVVSYTLNFLGDCGLFAGGSGFTTISTCAMSGGLLTLHGSIYSDNMCSLSTGSLVYNPASVCGVPSFLIQSCYTSAPPPPPPPSPAPLGSMLTTSYLNSGCTGAFQQDITNFGNCYKGSAGYTMVCII